MADLATLQAWLIDAETKYHNLVTGAAAEEVEHGDMRQRFAKSESDKLATYIIGLKAQIRALGGDIAGTARRGIIVDL